MIESTENIKYTVWEYDSVIPGEICDYIINKYSSQELNFALINNGGYDPEIRKVLSLIVERTDWVTSLFHYYGFDANYENFNYKISGVSNPQFLKYEPGMFYKVHSDVSKNRDSDSFYRKLTIVLNLSDSNDYEGGDLVVFSEGLSAKKLNRNRGTISVFSSYLSHKVNPIKSGIRYSMVSWIMGEPFS